MSERDLELLITLDDPMDPQEEDTFNHLPSDNTFAYWFNQPSPAKERYDQTEDQ